MAKSITVDNSALANQGMRNALTKLQTNAVDMVLNTGTLAIKAGGSALAKTSAAVSFIIDGVYGAKAAADMPALAGSIAAGKKGLFVFTVNAAGTLASIPGTLTATDLDDLVFPTIPAGAVVIGFLVIQNGTASAFVSGTTALDTTDVTTTYVNTPFPFNPNALSL